MGKILTYGKNEEINNATSYFTPNMKAVIEQLSSLSDLDVILSDDGNFSEHVDHLCKK